MWNTRLLSILLIASIGSTQAADLRIHNKFKSNIKPTVHFDQIVFLDKAILGIAAGGLPVAGIMALGAMSAIGAAAGLATVAATAGAAATAAGLAATNLALAISANVAFPTALGAASMEATGTIAGGVALAEASQGVTVMAATTAASETAVAATSAEAAATTSAATASGVTIAAGVMAAIVAGVIIGGVTSELVARELAKAKQDTKTIKPSTSEVFVKGPQIAIFSLFIEAEGKVYKLPVALPESYIETLTVAPYKGGLKWKWGAPPADIDERYEHKTNYSTAKKAYEKAGLARLISFFKWAKSIDKAKKLQDAAWDEIILTPERKAADEAFSKAEKKRKAAKADLVEKKKAEKFHENEYRDAAGGDPWNYIISDYSSVEYKDIIKNEIAALKLQIKETKREKSRLSKKKDDKHEEWKNNVDKMWKEPLLTPKRVAFEKKANKAAKKRDEYKEMAKSLDKELDSLEKQLEAKQKSLK